MSDEKKQLSKVTVPLIGIPSPQVFFRPDGGGVSCWWPNEGPARLIVRVAYKDQTSKVWEYLPHHIGGPVERCYA